MKQVTPAGFIDSEGNEHEVDIIICATGFNTSWIPRFPVEANGHSIAEMWAKEATSYISIGVPHSKRSLLHLIHQVVIRVVTDNVSPLFSAQLLHDGWTIWTTGPRIIPAHPRNPRRQHHPVYREGAERPNQELDPQDQNSRAVERARAALPPKDGMDLGL